MIHVCEMITELAPAGAERMVYELATRLDRSRFTVCVAALRGGVVADQLRRAGVEVFVLGVSGKWDVLKIRALANWLRGGPGRAAVDILHTHLFHADLAGRLAAWLAGTPHIVHSVHVAERRFVPWRRLYGRAFMRRGPVVCVSESVREHHVRWSGISAGRHVVIENGIDLAAYARDESRGLAFRRRLGVGEGDVLAVWAGRLCDQKGLDVLLQALPLVAERLHVPRLVLAIAGQGPWRGMVEEFVRSQAADSPVRVELLGFVDDMAGLYSAGDFLVMPSRWEGFGLSAVEAMAAGLPVIATDVEGLRDVMGTGRGRDALETRGQDAHATLSATPGMVIPPENPAALADAIVRLAQDATLRQQMSIHARRRAEAFSVERVINHPRSGWLEEGPPEGACSRPGRPRWGRC